MRGLKIYRKLKSPRALLWSLILVGLACGVFQSRLVYADELKDCMSLMMDQVEGSMTIDALRLECQKQIRKGVFQGQEQKQKPAAVSERLKQDKQNILEPFTLMAHKPNYFLVGAYNSNGYNAKLFQEQYRNDSISLDDTEAQFQISLKVPLFVNLFDTVDVYGAYTNRSFWQYYNSDISSPFRETNHEPELWFQFSPKWEFIGFSNSANSLGIVHQSNGQGGVLSRSWNRLYANFVLEKGNFAISFKPWFRLPESDKDDDNPDITDYLGHSEIRAAYAYKEHVMSIMSRNNLESGFKKGAVELSWSFPLGNYPFLKGYVQYFGGYGESMIDYDNYVNRVGIGFALTDFL